MQRHYVPLSFTFVLPFLFCLKNVCVWLRTLPKSFFLNASWATRLCKRGLISKQHKVRICVLARREPCINRRVKGQTHCLWKCEPWFAKCECVNHSPAGIVGWHMVWAQGKKKNEGCNYTYINKCICFAIILSTLLQKHHILLGA